MSQEEEDQNDTTFDLIQTMHKCGRPKDTVFFLQKIASVRQQIPEDLLNIFVQAHKDFINEKRYAIHAVDEEIAKNDLPEDNEYTLQLSVYRHKKYDDLYFSSERIISIIDKTLMPHAKTERSKFIYYKLKADLLRYLAEFAPEKDIKKYVDDSKIAYQCAIGISDAEYDPASKENLGLVLNYSVLLYEFLNQKEDAIRLIERTFNKVQKNIYENPSKYVSSRPYLQMLRDNSSLWRHETDISEEQATDGIATAPAQPKQEEQNNENMTQEANEEKTENQENENQNTEQGNNENNEGNSVENKENTNNETEKQSNAQNDTEIKQNEEKNEGLSNNK